MTGIFSLSSFLNKRPRSKRRKLFSRTEALESRQLLSADFSTGLSAVNMLAVDPNAYDHSSVLVRYRTDGDAGPPGIAGFQVPSGVTIVNAGMNLGILPGMHEFSLPEGLSVAEAIDAFQDDPNVLYAEPNYIVRIATTPNDKQFDALWGMNNTGQTGGTTDADIDAVEAWDITTGTGSTIIAIIDSGVDYTHPDLAANIWVNPGEIPGDGIDNDGNGYIDDIHGYDFVNDDPDPMDDLDHGTHVAGTIGGLANNNKGVAGVNWNATIMPVKFITSTGSGSLGDAIAALDYAVANGADISNNSWGFNGGFSQFLFDAIQNAQSAGHIFVAAAGNGDGFGNGLNNDVSAFYPSNFDLDNVVAVAATDHNDNKASFSN
jgi:subtilisin family serine protease